MWTGLVFHQVGELKGPEECLPPSSRQIQWVWTAAFEEQEKWERTDFLFSIMKTKGQKKPSDCPNNCSGNREDVYMSTPHQLPPGFLLQTPQTNIHCSLILHYIIEFFPIPAPHRTPPVAFIRQHVELCGKLSNILMKRLKAIKFLCFLQTL